MLTKFLAGIEEALRVHSIYVWGAQGETGAAITEKWIRGRETSTTNANRAIAFWKKMIAAGFGAILRAFDCSGLGVYHLNKLGLMKGDASANTLMGKCSKLAKSALRRGDWVFKVYTADKFDKSGKRTQKKGDAYHIGYVVDDALNVIEAQGRDYGVVKRALNAGGWNAYGRPSFFKAEIEGAGSTPALPAATTKPATKPATPALGGTSYAWIVTRNMKRTAPPMRGEDIKGLQRALIASGYGCGTAAVDGVFGKETEKAVRAFQASKRLNVDGIAGKQTVTALGGKFGL